MSILDSLASCAGSWRGNTRLQDPMNNVADESQTMATISRVLKGKFVRFDYRWDYKGDPQEGSILFGYSPSSDEARRDHIVISFLCFRDVSAAPMTF